MLVVRGAEHLLLVDGTVAEKVTATEVLEAVVQTSPHIIVTGIPLTTTIAGLLLRVVVVAKAIPQLLEEMAVAFLETMGGMEQPQVERGHLKQPEAQTTLQVHSGQPIPLTQIMVAVVAAVGMAVHRVQVETPIQVVVAARDTYILPHPRQTIQQDAY